VRATAKLSVVESDGTPLFDPDDVAAIRDALAADLAGRLGPLTVSEGPERFGGGMDTYVYAFRLAGDISPAWAAPLVLRVFPSMGQVAKAEREAAMQTFAVEKGILAPKPLLVDTSGTAFGLPFMIMERMRGAPMLSRIKNPLNMPGMLKAMAALQARLHSLPTDGCPIPYERPLVDEWLSRSRELVNKFHPAGLDRPLAWLETHIDMVKDEEPVLTHNDFHPMNLLIDGDRMALLDWPDAALGDRHCDVARTLALLYLAGPLAQSAIERTVLRLLRGYIVSKYRREYESHLPLDVGRIRYWQVLHAFGVWAQLAVMRQEGEAAIGAREGVLGEIPDSIFPALESYVDERIR